MKICKSCNIELDDNMFGKCKTNKDGLEGKCKKCRLEERKKYINICEFCNTQFKTANKNAKYCSQKCLPQSRNKKNKIKCDYCGKEIERNNFEMNYRKNHYCSNECKNKDYSLKYSEANSPRYSKITTFCSVCGNDITRNIFEIKKYNRHYCSKECKIKDFKIIFKGENHPSYNPNLSNEERIITRKFYAYVEWRNNIYKRDDYKCRCCGDSTGHNLNAHHILNYSEHPEQRLLLENGITLCKKCHKDFHDTYGYKHNNKKQLDNFLRNHVNTVPSLNGNIFEGVTTR